MTEATPAFRALDLFWRLPLWFILAVFSGPVMLVALTFFTFQVFYPVVLAVFVISPFAFAWLLGLFGRRMRAGGKMAVAAASLVILYLSFINAVLIGCAVGTMLHDKGACL